MASIGVGTYPFAIGVGTLSAANYDFPAAGLIGNTLTVNPAALTITASAETKVYGAAVPAVTYEVTGLVNNDTASVVSGAPSITTPGLASIGAGMHSFAIGVGTLSAANYDFPAADLIGNTLTVTAAPLTITASAQTRFTLAPNPVLTASYSGFVNGDSSINLVKLPTLSTTATASSVAGMYPIVASGAASPNYVIKYVGGILTVVNPIVVVNVENASIQKQIAIKGRKRTTTDVIVVQFSGPLDATSAQVLDDYTLGTVPKGKQKSKNDVLTKAAYSASASTVTLTPKRQPLVFKPGVRLTINAPAISSISGQPVTGGTVVITLNRIGVNVSAPT